MPPWIDLPVTEIVSRYLQDHESTHQLGSDYGVSDLTISARLRAAGVKMRSCGAPFGNKNRLGHYKRGGSFHVAGDGYLATYDRDGKRCDIHRGCWEAYHGAIPNGHIVHHVDENRLHNVIENLACMSPGQHTTLHNLSKSPARAGPGGASFHSR